MYTHQITKIVCNVPVIGQTTVIYFAGEPQLESENKIKVPGFLALHTESSISWIAETKVWVSFIEKILFEVLKVDLKVVFWGSMNIINKAIYKTSRIFAVQLPIFSSMQLDMSRNFFNDLQ